MKTITLKKLIFLVLACLCYWVNAQEVPITFKRLSSEDGLSQSFVHCLLKDKNGFAWAGTQDGLNQYDGYYFRNFYNEQGDSLDLQDQYIWSLYEGQDSTIWIGTNGGFICSYTSDQDKIGCYKFEEPSNKTSSSVSFRSIFQTSTGQLLLGTSEGLLKFNPLSRVFEKIEGSGTQAIFSFLRVSEKLILVGGLEQIMIYNEENHMLQKCQLSHSILAGIHDMVQSENGTIWLGTGKGLYQTRLNQNSLELQILQQHLPSVLKANAISSSHISALTIDQYGKLWICSDNGLNYYDPLVQEKGFYHYKSNLEKEQSLSSNLIHDIIEVEPDVFWLATQEGINQFSIAPTGIESINLGNISSRSCGQSIHGMAMISEKHLLACTEKGLLDIDFQNSDTPQIRCFDKTTFPEMSDEFLVNIKKGQEGKFWVAMRRGGFAAFQPRESGAVWKTYKLPAGAYSNIGTNDFEEDINGNLWIASSGLGLWKYDQKKMEFESFQASKSNSSSLSGNYIFSLTKDENGFLWISTAEGGLCKKEHTDSTFTCFLHNPIDPFSISNNMVLATFEDSKRRIWVCTANGLNLMLNSGKFQRFYKKDGLPNNVIYGMLEDDQQQLWVSTDQGLSKIMEENDTFIFKNYSVRDGLLKQEFNQHSFVKAIDGRLLFGNNGGVNFFYPEALKKYQISPKSVFTDFKIFNHSVSVNDYNTKEDFTLKKHVNYTQNIELPYDQNFIAFEYSGINFTETKGNQYAYQLQGLDEKWIYAGERRFASYPNLKPGHYVFRLKSSNYQGVWEKEPKKIEVIVNKPPWNTWWAYLLYVISFCTLIYTFIRMRMHTVRQIEKTKSIERRRFRKRSARDFHDEAGNKITKISLMTELAKRKSQEYGEIHEIFSDIETNIQELRIGMRDFIWVIDPDNDNLYQTLIRLKTFANDIFEYSPINFTTSGIDESLISVSIKGEIRRHILLIYKEAINNCLKYSQASNASLDISFKNSNLKICLNDNGIGFDVHLLSGGNGINNINSRAKKIGAMMKISSDSASGTQVCLNLKITQMND